MDILILENYFISRYNKDEMIGFETIGNATVTVFDDIPILTTDPWIYGKPYFGSWTHNVNSKNSITEH